MIHYVQVMDPPQYDGWRTDTVGKRRRCDLRRYELDRRGEVCRILDAHERVVIDMYGEEER